MSERTFGGLVCVVALLVLLVAHCSLPPHPGRNPDGLDGMRNLGCASPTQETTHTEVNPRE